MAVTSSGGACVLQNSVTLILNTSKIEPNENPKNLHSEIMQYVAKGYYFISSVLEINVPQTVTSEPMARWMDSLESLSFKKQKKKKVAPIGCSIMSKYSEVTHPTEHENLYKNIHAI